jgi:tRNA modification GTPase
MNQKQILLTNRHLLADDSQAIVALCTPRGSGAISLIRITGDNAVAVADAIARLSSGKSLADLPSHTIHHGYVVAPSNRTDIIDEVLFLLMRAPKTFTGQDTVEITAHNNHFIIEKIIDSAVTAGARIARSGEFTKRAFLMGKIDLVQAEAINDVIHAQTELALKQSMAQVQGSLSQYLATVEADIVSLLGYVEASFEFLDEEQRDLDFDNAIRARTQKTLDLISTIKGHFAQQKQVKEGVRVAIIGTVNAGKSTLFNALVGKERAIVADLAGTTRDSIETSLYRHGTFMLMIDTAGIRQTNDVIEQKGIERSFAEAESADLVLLVQDATRHLSAQEETIYTDLKNRYADKLIYVFNKCEATVEVLSLHNPALAYSTLHIAAKERRGITQLEAAIDQKIQNLFGQLKSPYLLNQRHFKLLTEIESTLAFIAKSCQASVQYELVAYHLKDLLEKISELTGRNITENILDMVFNEFCVGK